MSEDRPQPPVPAEWRSRLLELPRLNKRIILVALDFLLLTLALWISISIRYNAAYVPPNWYTALVLFSGPFLTIMTFALSGLYRFVTRYLGYRGHTRIIGCIWLSVLIWSLVVLMSGQLGIPRSVVLGYGVLATLLIAGSREVAAMILESAGIRLSELPANIERTPVIIFGAGHLGVQLLEALRRSYNRTAVAFIDTEPSLWRQYVSGLKVHHPDKLPMLIARHQVKEILVAMPDERRRERRRILKDLQEQPVEVKVLPAVEDIASGRVSVTDLRPVEVNDLLGRDKVPPNADLLARKSRGKSILITGAGGSIGSELVRQLLKQAPRRIVLLDISEAALYQIEDEITDLINAMRPEFPRPELVGVLGSVLDAAQLRETIVGHGVQVIYHAAAYKHVPIVEQNAVCGLRNNTFGTATLAECAQAAGVELVVLISTDKAVRPTNVMGASKRLAELVLQAAAANGGPDRLHHGALRQRARQLGLRRQEIPPADPRRRTGDGHAPRDHPLLHVDPRGGGAGHPGGRHGRGRRRVRARHGRAGAHRRSGAADDPAVRLRRQDRDNPEGDIAIAYTGLRSGEKLYEELLIGANTKATEHPRIWRSDEPFLPSEELERELEILKAAMDMRDLEAMQAVLMRNVEGYQSKAVVPTGEESQLATWTPPTRTLH